jgi:hypothetical protein
MIRTITVLAAVCLACSTQEAATEPLLRGRSDVAELIKETTALEIGYPAGETALSVTNNLILPERGAQGTPIVWTSSSPAIVATNGRVARPDCADRTVVLTACLKRGRLRRFRTFLLQVRRLGEPATGWSRTISLDGQISDGEWRFAETEIATSSPERLRAFLAWDAEFLYLGCRGPDLAQTTDAAGEKWLQAYFGIPCRDGDNEGSTNAQAFRSQAFSLPFRAHTTLKWRPSDFFYNSAAVENQIWKYTTSRTAPHYNPLGVGAEQAVRKDDTLELRIPRRKFGNPDRLRLLVFMISEQTRAEALWGIVPAAAGVDHAVRGSIRHRFRAWIEIDFASPLPPRAQADRP